MLPPMRVFILRHGKAEKDSPTGRDFDRELAPRGREQADHVGLALKAGSGGVRGVRPPGIILASRAVRARTTAEIVGERLALSVEFAEELLVDEPVGPVVELVQSRAATTPAGVMLVGHNPQLESLVAQLARPAGFVGLRTGELYVIQMNEGRVVGRERLDE